MKEHPGQFISLEESQATREIIKDEALENLTTREIKPERSLCADEKWLEAEQDEGSPGEK